jgi:hypothetical protein
VQGKAASTEFCDWSTFILTVKYVLNQYSDPIKYWVNNYLSNSRTLKFSGLNSTKLSINVCFLDLAPCVPWTIYSLQKWICFNPIKKWLRGIFWVASNKNSYSITMDNRLSRPILVSVRPNWVCIATLSSSFITFHNICVFLLESYMLDKSRHHAIIFVYQNTVTTWQNCEKSGLMYFSVHWWNAETSNDVSVI